MPPKSLRGALDSIQRMLDDQPYSAELWDILVALRGPDTRNRKLKYATTAIIRSSAFPKRPRESSSIFGYDNAAFMLRRRDMFRRRLDHNHFREHVRDAFAALDLKVGGVNGTSDSKSVGRKRQRRNRS